MRKHNKELFPAPYRFCLHPFHIGRKHFEICQFQDMPNCLNNLGKKMFFLMGQIQCVLWKIYQLTPSKYCNLFSRKDYFVFYLPGPILDLNLVCVTVTPRRVPFFKKVKFFLFLTRSNFNISEIFLRDCASKLLIQSVTTMTTFIFKMCDCKLHRKNLILN